MLTKLFTIMGGGGRERAVVTTDWILLSGDVVVRVLRDRSAREGGEEEGLGGGGVGRGGGEGRKK